MAESSSHGCLPDPDNDTLPPEQQERALRTEIEVLEGYFVDANRSKAKRLEELLRYPQNRIDPVMTELTVDNLHNAHMREVAGSIAERLEISRQRLKQLTSKHQHDASTGEGEALVA